MKTTKKKKTKRKRKGNKKEGENVVKIWKRKNQNEVKKIYKKIKETCRCITDKEEVWKEEEEWKEEEYEKKREK